MGVERKREERKKGKGIPLGSRAPFSLSTLAKGRTFLKWMRDPMGSQPSKPGWAPRQADYSSSGPRLDQALWGRRIRRRERKRVERSQLNILPTPFLYPQEIKCSWVLGCHSDCHTKNLGGKTPRGHEEAICSQLWEAGGGGRTRGWGSESPGEKKLREACQGRWCRGAWNLPCPPPLLPVIQKKNGWRPPQLWCGCSQIPGPPSGDQLGSCELPSVHRGRTSMWIFFFFLNFQFHLRTRHYLGQCTGLTPLKSFLKLRKGPGLTDQPLPPPPWLHTERSTYPGLWGGGWIGFNPPQREPAARFSSLQLL
ncbi:uncharacterized protein LOC128314937 [Acinonyx jubatus]|uniref:Uncharacterized protein LOC128314937 n=1 Tax=Acinonyx jubatus TaxID=32536 RepID=A0ABM3PVN9_ACIJB|nr:uncharacterized protein LOC128314937 [Acinonyx jubatus]